MKPQYIKIDEYGDKSYYSDKAMTIYHREDGPAIEWADGDKHWYLNGKCHRADGPAVEWAEGSKSWAYGYKSWYINWANGSKATQRLSDAAIKRRSD